MINVTKTFLPDIKSYERYVSSIFTSGRITNYGPLNELLEKRLEEYLGVENLILVANGTLALQLAYKLLGLKGEVITTPFSFVATTSSIVWEGMRPVFADIDYSTLNIDYREIEKKITSETSAIVPVHVFGNACDVENIDILAENYGLKVVYDAAHAFGVKYKGNSILNFGDISTLSFHATKLFHTIEGGALIIKNPEVYKRARKIIDFGIDGPDRIVSLGINAKMNDFQAAMGLCVLENINYILGSRKVAYERYVKAFSHNDNIKLQFLSPNMSYNYSYFPIIFKSEAVMLKVRDKLNSKDIFPRRYFYPSLDNLNYVDSDFMSNSNSVAERILCIPLYDSLSEYDQSRIIDVIVTETN